MSLSIIEFAVYGGVAYFTLALVISLIVKHDSAKGFDRSLLRSMFIVPGIVCMGLLSTFGVEITLYESEVETVTTTESEIDITNTVDVTTSINTVATHDLTSPTSNNGRIENATGNTISTSTEAGSANVRGPVTTTGTTVDAGTSTETGNTSETITTIESVDSKIVLEDIRWFAIHGFFFLILALYLVFQLIEFAVKAHS